MTSLAVAGKVKASAGFGAKHGAAELAMTTARERPCERMDLYETTNFLEVAACKPS